MLKLLRRQVAVQLPLPHATGAGRISIRGVRTRKPPLPPMRPPPENATAAKAVVKVAKMPAVQLLTIDDLVSQKSSMRESTKSKKGSSNREAPSSSSSSSSSKSSRDNTSSLQDDELTIDKTWNWIPPRHKPGEAAEAEAAHAPKGSSKARSLKSGQSHFTTKLGVELTAEEITSALLRMGAEDVRTINLPKSVNFDTIKQFVIASSRSTRLLRKMADSVVQELQDRRLNKAPGSTGAEGELDDDWLIVDCWNIAVHIMLPHTRKSVNLEALWDGSIPRPALRQVRNEKEYDEMMDDLVQRFPPPADYPPLEDAPELLKGRDVKDLPVRRL